MLEKVFENNINCLYNQLKNNVFNSSNANIVYKNSKYELNDVLRFEDFLACKNNDIKLFCLKLLCRFGGSINTYYSVSYNDVYFETSSGFLIEIIRIAEEQKDTDVLLNVLQNCKGVVNNVILSLRKLKRMDCLTSLMFSEDEELVEIVTRLINEI